MGSLGQNLIHLGPGYQKRVPTIGAFVGRTGALVSVTVKHGRIRSIPDKFAPGKVYRFSMIS